MLHLAANMARRRAGPRRAAEAIQIARRCMVYGAMQKRSELAPFLAVVLKRRPRTVVEIGRGRGGTLWALCRAAADDATIVSVDLPGGPFGGMADTADIRDRLAAHAGPGQHLHLVQADSRAPETVERVRELAPQVDLLFIDGDHTYEGVAADYELYAPLVRPGGLIAFHDILPHSAEVGCEVDRFWDELAGEKIAITSPSEENARGQWGGIGILEAPASDAERRLARGSSAPLTE